MNFTKMEGLGNDFIVTHEVEEKDIFLVQKQVAALCDRRRGIGADGIIFVLKSDTCDFRMRIFNSDGSEPEMCGNGVRCFALYADLFGLSNSRKLTIETLAGKIVTEVLDHNKVMVNMGKPVLDAPNIPVKELSGRVVQKSLRVDNKDFKITAVSMGNPHAVIYVKDEITDELVHVWGPKIEVNEFFPKKTNVEFIKVLSAKEIQMRVWERGCGETQACGTGACASAVSGIINGLHENEVTVHLPGGDLEVSWSGDANDPVFMTGPANAVFAGSIQI